jgi:hypothetical protein
MAKVMGGIAEALIATGVGIFVAIPAVVAYNVIQKKAGEIETHAQSLARLVTAWLHTYPEARDAAEPVASKTSAPLPSARGEASRSLSRVSADDLAE